MRMTERSADDESRLFERLCELPAAAQAAELEALAQARPALARRLRRLLSIDAEYAAHTAASALAQAAALADATGAIDATDANGARIAGDGGDAEGDGADREGSDRDGANRDGADREGMDRGGADGAATPHAARRGADMQVGPFRLLHELGRGGMGVVYRAERRSGFAQPVAIKLLPRFADDAPARARFARERRLLAQLRHPHICGILDGGELDDGTPWLAMELVEGESLCAWCARRALPLRARVQLFLQLCDAVQYAHRRLVVHRDIKDANVLVEEMLADDGPGRRQGRARLLDFGIAKALDGDAEAASGPGFDAGPDAGEGQHTLADERVFSPLSAAPEQLHGQRTTTAVDVYALGALLHQLLTGRLPFADIARDRMALQRAILERVPPPASAALQRAQDAGRIARTHPVAPRALRGDLDAIVARCLRKDPDERYADVAELARDLRAWLEGRPVAAAAGERWGGGLYRLRKFVARHRSASALGALALLSLAFAFAATLWRSAELRAQRDAAQAARAQSEIDRDRARAVAGFMRETFEQADPGRAAEGGLLARDLIGQGLQRLDRLDAQPEVQAELALLLAESQQALGLDRDSRALLARHAPGIAALAEDDPALRWRHARLQAVHAVALDPDRAAAEAPLARLAALADSPERRVELARVRERWAVRRSQFDRAAVLLETAWAEDAAALSEDARLALRLDLAGALLSAGRDAEALRLLAPLDETVLASHLPALQIRAWRVRARALKLRLDAQGGDRAGRDGDGLDRAEEDRAEKGRSELDRSDLDRALRAWRRAAEQLYGPQSLEVASALIWSIGAEPDPAAQERALQRAYAIQRERLPANTLARALAEYNAGYYWLSLRRDPARAEPHLARAVASGRAAAGRAHSDVRRFEASWADSLLALGRHERVLAALADPPPPYAATPADAPVRARLQRALATAAERAVRPASEPGADPSPAPSDGR